jgi:hypothetical protein
MFLAFSLVLSWVLLTTGCGGKGEAETAIQAADAAIAAVRADGEMYAPEDFARVSSAADSAHAMFDQGDYKRASAIAATIPALADAVKQTATTAREAMTQEWSTLESTVPGMVQAITVKMSEMTASKRRPKGMTPEQVTAIQGQAETMNQLWNQATAAALAGQVKDAVDGGRRVRAMAEEILTQLGMTVPAGT